MTEKISKEEAGYKRATSEKSCGNCNMFYRKGAIGRCTLVEGSINEKMVCDNWAPK